MTDELLPPQLRAKLASHNAVPPAEVEEVATYSTAYPQTDAVAERLRNLRDELDRQSKHANVGIWMACHPEDPSVAEALRDFLAQAQPNLHDREERWKFGRPGDKRTFPMPPTLDHALYSVEVGLVHSMIVERELYYAYYAHGQDDPLREHAAALIDKLEKIRLYAFDLLYGDK